MPETTSRYLFIVELVVFALPCIAFMLSYGVFLGGGGLLFAGAFLVGSVASLAGVGPGTSAATMAEASQLIWAVGFYGGAGLVALAGVVALFKFMRVSHDFARYGRAILPEIGKPLRRALLWSVVPLAVWMPFVALSVASDDPAGKVMAVCFSGVPLLVPILHLWIELRSLPSRDEAMGDL